MPETLSAEVKQLIDRPNFAHFATLMPDGSPNATPVWIGREGDRIVICTSETSLKTKNTKRDPRVALSIVDFGNPYEEVQIRGRVVDLAKYIQRDRVPKCDGTLSYTAFKNRLLELDYKKKTVRVSAALTADLKCPGFCGDITYPTFGKQGPPIVVATGFTINAKPLTVQIDTLFSGTMLVYSPSVDKLGLTSQSASSEKEFFRYTDDGVDMIKSRVDDESFGSHPLAKSAPVFFPTPAVHQPDGMFDGTVGHALFKDIVLTLDLHANHVWIS
jgi:PPOX class probable F420-dependent enzyme